jgi:hypothetical protein
MGINKLACIIHQPTNNSRKVLIDHNLTTDGSDNTDRAGYAGSHQ